MKTTGYVGLLALAALVGCSGRFEVGQMTGGSASVHEPKEQESQGGGNAATGSGQGGEVVNTAGQPTSGCVPGQMDCGNAGEGQPVDPLGELCVPLGKPAQLAGQFAEPAVVWKRVSPLIWGEQRTPPSTLPAMTSYKWAGQIVADAFAQAREEGAAPGALAFVQEWLFPDAVDPSNEKPELEAPWSMLLATDTPALQALLRYRTDEHVGVFSERNWLAINTSISRRGLAISAALFQRAIPAPPPNVDMTFTPVPGLTRRQALEQHRSNPACSACHQLMDPLGYPFEVFDSTGQYRLLDNNLPIDTSGQYPSSSPPLDYEDADDFGRQVAGTCDAQVGLADGFLKAALVLNGIPLEGRQPLFEANSARIRQAFVRSNRTYEDLVRAYAQSPLGLR